MTNRIEKTEFGILPDGQIADLYTLRNLNGMEVQISNFGGIITHLSVKDKFGKFENVVLAYDHFENYISNQAYFGAIIGRFANRISNGKFSLDNTTYNLDKNSDGNALHGGFKGLDKVLWKATTVYAAEPALMLYYFSPDGEGGFPGNLEIEVKYTLRTKNALQIDYSATSDKKTVVNFTNHAYFNLTGDYEKNILSHQMCIQADKYLEVDDKLIPTGKLLKVKNTPLDFLMEHTIGERINDSFLNATKGYDHCLVLEDLTPKLKNIAQVFDKQSGRKMEVFTTEPAVQLYTANGFETSMLLKNGIKAKPYTGFCLETQHFPDAPNQLNFPSTVLNPGEIFRSTTIYAFS